MIRALPASGPGKGSRPAGILLTLGLILLAGVVAGCAAVDVPRIERTHGVKTDMSQRILVAYATRAGSTAEVADRIGGILAKRGAVADVKPLGDVGTVENYHAVVIGSAVRAGRVLPEARDFVLANRSALRKVPTALFVVCMTLKDDTPENRKVVDAYLDPLRAEVTPVASGLFAGRLDYSRLGFFTRLVAKYMANAPEGDYRDWRAIEQWAENIAHLVIVR